MKGLNLTHSNSAAWLPDLRVIARMLETSADDLLPKLIREALVVPAVDLVERPSKRIRAALVELGAELIGRRQARADAIQACSAAVEVLHAGSLVVDDVQDSSDVRRGAPSLHLKYGLPMALCTGNWLYFWSLRLIDHAGLSPEQELAAYKAHRDAVEKAHFGQALDLSVRAGELPQFEVPSIARAILELKAGALTALAMSLGATAAGASSAQSAAVSGFGLRFGVVLQQLDDFGNILGRTDPEKRREDLRHRKLSAVWLHAAKRFDTSDYGAFVAAADRLASGDEGPLNKFLTTHNFIELAVADARAEIDLAFAELRDSEAIDPGAIAIDKLRVLTEGLMHAYF